VPTGLDDIVVERPDGLVDLLIGQVHLGTRREPLYLIARLCIGLTSNSVDAYKEVV
jgi:hypothetical protein